MIPRSQIVMQQEILPRPGSVMYDFIHGTEEEKLKRQKQFVFWNKWLVTPLYRINILPLFGIGRIFLMLYHIGRKSGMQYITPVEYRKKDGKILVFASRGKRTDWYRNIVANPEKTKVKIGFRSFQPRVMFPSPEEKLEIMKWYCTSFGSAAKMLFGWDKKQDEATDEMLSNISDFIEIILFEK